jgi:hypothetical protein
VKSHNRMRLEQSYETSVKAGSSVKRKRVAQRHWLVVSVARQRGMYATRQLKGFEGR